MSNTNTNPQSPNRTDNYQTIRVVNGDALLDQLGRWVPRIRATDGVELVYAIDADGLKGWVPYADVASGGSGSTQVYTGASPPAAPDDPTKAALFYPSGGGALQQWDIGGAAWV